MFWCFFSQITRHCQDSKPIKDLFRIHIFSESDLSSFQLSGPWSGNMAVNLLPHIFWKQKAMFPHKEHKMLQCSYAVCFKTSLASVCLIASESYAYSKSAIWYEILCLPLKSSVWRLTCQRFSQGDKHLFKSAISFRKQHLDSWCEKSEYSSSAVWVIFQIAASLRRWEEITGLIFPAWSCDVRID